jgi:hypothetical protein
MKTIAILTLFISTIICQGQSPNENLEKYWQYRNRVTQNFLKVGSSAGESIPMSARSIGFPYSGSDTQTRRVYWQDATIYLGHYLSVLGSEVKLLLSSYQSSSDNIEKQILLNQLEQTKNELYYAIEAANRLDRKAEVYLAQSDQQPSPDDLNGLILRDDVPQNFFQNYIDDHSPIFNRNCNFVNTDSGHSQTQQYGRDAEAQGTRDNCYSPEARPAGFHSEYQCNNVMSLDQVTSFSNDRK